MDADVYAVARDEVGFEEPYEGRDEEPDEEP